MRKLILYVVAPLHDLHPSLFSPSLLLREQVEVECDVAIVGGGPAGCACALYTSRADLKTVIIDKNPAIGALAITSAPWRCFQLLEVGESSLVLF